MTRPQSPDGLRVAQLPTPVVRGRIRRSTVQAVLGGELARSPEPPRIVAAACALPEGLSGVVLAPVAPRRAEEALDEDGEPVRASTDAEKCAEPECDRKAMTQRTMCKACRKRKQRARQRQAAREAVTT